MASILLTIAGSVAGNAILPGIGGAILGGVGATIGHSIDAALFGQSVVKGPRLDSLKVQDSAYGNGIPVMYGTVRAAGNVIWTSDLIETLSTDSVGGKGVGGGTQVERASYAVDCAIALGFGPIGAIQTIWADSKQIYSAGSWQPGVVWDAEFYSGSSGQSPSPLMESALGSGNVPAYRNIAYVVLHRLQLGNFGNRMPNFTFEIAASAASITPRLLGSVEPGLASPAEPLICPMAMPPVTVSARGANVTKTLVGACNADEDGNYCFTAVEYDVTGDAPLELARTASDFTDLGELSVQDITTCASPSGRFVAFCMHFGDPNPAVLAIYDVQARRFGDLLVDTPGDYEAVRQIAWLDEQRLVIMDKQGGNRGVRVYAAAGLSLSVIDFVDVWGAFSAARLPLEYAQFAVMNGGLYMLAANHASTPTTLYGRGLVWQDSALQLGAEATLSTGLDNTSTFHASLIALSGGEYVLARHNTSTIDLFSFVPGFDAPSMTRDWTALTLSPAGNIGVNGQGNRLWFLHQAFTVGELRYGEISLDAASFSLSASGTVMTGDYELAGNNYFNAYAVDSRRFLLLDGDNSSAIILAGLFERGAGKSLATVVGDVLARAGYAEEDYDVSALEDEAVQGYSVPEPMAARAALSPLQTAFSFDLIESDAILKARMYGAVPDVELDNAETRAALEKDDVPPRSLTLRAQELDLPREMTVTYIDPVLDYQKGSQRARRLTGAAHSSANINLPVVCDADQAKQVAEAQLFRAWAERSQISFTLSRAYAALDPGDVVSLEGRALRLTDVRSNGGLINAEALAVDGAALSASATAANSGLGLSRSAATLVPSTLFLMDVPLLRNEDDQPGFYAGLSGRDGWRGAALYRSADGVSYALVSSFSLPACCGLAADVLADAPPAYMDRVNSVTVGLLRGEVSSCSLAELLNGANAALLGDEIIQFQTAVLNDDGSYTLSNLLRGRRATPTDTHAAGERFVLLQTETVRFLPLTLSDRGRDYDFRAASTGQDVSEAA
nr:phage tail protein [Alphaproteobacteria bacterium]